MAQLSADTSRTYHTAYTKFNETPVAASTTIYGGSAVGLSSGYARQLVAGDTFVGFAVARASNVADPYRPNFAPFGTLLGNAGAINVEVYSEGIIVLPSITGASSVTDVGSAVYMSDGNTFTLTSTSNSKIGTISAFVNGKFEVSFQSTLTKAQ